MAVLGLVFLAHRVRAAEKGPRHLDGEGVIIDDPVGRRTEDAVLDGQPLVQEGIERGIVPPFEHALLIEGRFAPLLIAAVAQVPDPEGERAGHLLALGGPIDVEGEFAGDAVAVAQVGRELVKSPGGELRAGRFTRDIAAVIPFAADVRPDRTRRLETGLIAFIKAEQVGIDRHARLQAVIARFGMNLAQHVQQTEAGHRQEDARCQHGVTQDAARARSHSVPPAS